MSIDQKQAVHHYRQRLVIKQNLEQPPCTKSKILAALRASPLVGAELDLDRPVVQPRKVSLPLFPKAEAGSSPPAP